MKTIHRQALALLFLVHWHNATRAELIGSTGSNLHARLRDTPGAAQHHADKAAGYARQRERGRAHTIGLLLAWSEVCARNGLDEDELLAEHLGTVAHEVAGLRDELLTVDLDRMDQQAEALEVAGRIQAEFLALLPPEQGSKRQAGRQARGTPARKARNKRPARRQQ